MDEAAEHAAQSHAGAVDDVADALPHSALAERHKIRADEGGDGVQAASSGTRDETAEDDDPLVLGETAEQGADGEESARKDQASPSAVDVGQFSGQWLECRVRQEISTGQPGEQCEGVEARRDWT